MNLPNKITLTRIVLIPFVLFFYLAPFVPFGKLFALVLFLAAVLTDFLDGKLARKLGMVTTLGIFLDTIADKMLVLICLLPLVCDGTIFHPVGVIFYSILLCREFLQLYDCWCLKV